jgi:hypothetical protein
MSQQINLYNPIFLKKEKHFSARTMLHALGVIALGLAALCGYAFYASQAAERTAQQYRDQVASQRNQLTQLVAQLSAQGRSKALEAEIKRVQGEIAAKAATLEVLGTGELGNTAGFSEFFAAFGRQALSGVWLTGITIGDSGNELHVNGRALQAELVPAYLSALNREEMMRGRRVTELKLAARSAGATPGVAKGPEQFVEFAISAPLRVADAPAAKGATP